MIVTLFAYIKSKKRYTAILSFSSEALRKYCVQ